MEEVVERPLAPLLLCDRPPAPEAWPADDHAAWEERNIEEELHQWAAEAISLFEESPEEAAEDLRRILEATSRFRFPPSASLTQAVAELSSLCRRHTPRRTRTQSQWRCEDCGAFLRLDERCHGCNRGPPQPDGRSGDELSAEGYQVFVRMPHEELTSVDVRGTDTPTDILCGLGLNPADCYLTVRGKALQSTTRLSQVNIAPGIVLTVVARLRGAGTPSRSRRRRSSTCPTWRSFGPTEAFHPCGHPPFSEGRGGDDLTGDEDVEEEPGPSTAPGPNTNNHTSAGRGGDTLQTDGDIELNPGPSPPRRTQRTWRCPGCGTFYQMDERCFQCNESAPGSTPTPPRPPTNGKSSAATPTANVLAGRGVVAAPICTSCGPRRDCPRCRAPPTTTRPTTDASPPSPPQPTPPTDTIDTAPESITSVVDRRLGAQAVLASRSEIRTYSWAFVPLIRAAQALQQGHSGPHPRPCGAFSAQIFDEAVAHLAPILPPSIPWVSNGTYLQGDVQNALIRPVRDTTPIQRFYEECRRLDDPARRMGDRGLRAVAEGSLPLDSVNARGEVFVRDLVDDRLLDLYITNAAPSPPPPPTTSKHPSPEN